MSKPISISFGKKRVAAPSKPTKSFAPISLNSGPSKLALRHDSDDEDEQAPQHEVVTGFAADGAILGVVVEEKEELVIKNAGNSDWRRRGRTNLLPTEVQAQREAEAKGMVTAVEKDEVSKASGLKFAETYTNDQSQSNGNTPETQAEPPKQMTEDEAALHALLTDGTGERRSNAVILQSENSRPQGIDETGDFRADVASRPDSATLDEYAAMPVEEFGLAMLRGMGQKRKANGQPVNYDSNDVKAPKMREPRQGYLGIGAKAAPGAETELGAWGKADMRKIKKGEGHYTPVMFRDKRTGEVMTEEEFERRKSGAGKKGEDHWRERRDRNLERNGRDAGSASASASGGKEQKYITDKDDYRDQMNGFSRGSSERRHKERDGDRDGSSRSSSRRERSSSRERRGHDDEDRGYRERRRERHRNDERYDSSSSRRSGHRDRDRKRDRDRDDDRRRRDRDRH